jgi:hypothetical protein
MSGVDKGAAYIIISIILATHAISLLIVMLEAIMALKLRNLSNLGVQLAESLELG